jgi:hypothetical protein
MIKLTKSQVVAKLKRLSENETINITLCPSNCYPNPNAMWKIFVDIDLSKEDIVPCNVLGDYDESNINNFERHINSFAYYNCNSELGNRVHFYI